MAATVKTLIENHGELYWGTRHDMPGYCYGIALDVVEKGLLARLVYVMSEYDDDDEPLATPEVLMSCYTVDDLERNGIVSSTVMGDEGIDSYRGWYCVEESFFDKESVAALQESSAQLDDYLDIVLAVMTISADEIAAGMPSLDEISFFDLLDELEGISELIDAGHLEKPLPFEFRLINDALLGWQFANEEDWR